MIRTTTVAVATVRRIADDSNVSTVINPMSRNNAMPVLWSNNPCQPGSGGWELSG